MNLLKLVIYYIITLITGVVYLKCYSIITEKEIIYNKKNNIIIIFISLIMLINNNYNLNYYRVIISFIITLIFFKIIFKEKNKNALFYNIIFTIICCLIELLLSLFIMMSKININIFNDNIYIKIAFSLIELTCLYYFFKLNIIKKILIKTKIYLENFLNFYSFSLLIILMLNIVFYVRSDFLNNFGYLALGILCLLFIIISLNLIIKNKYNIEILKEKNKNIKNSIKAYSETIEECRELKHNLKNDLLSLSTIVPKKYYQEISDLINKYNKGFEWINRIGEIPEGLQGLIYLKINEAKIKKVKIKLSISKTIKTDQKDYIDLTEIISILIDNAIEACSKTKCKTIKIDIFEKNNSLNIKIINNYNNNIDLNKIGNKNYSTKEMKSGIGLDYIRKIKSNKIKVNFNIINNLFITNIVYKKI